MEEIEKVKPKFRESFTPIVEKWFENMNLCYEASNSNNNDLLGSTAKRVAYQYNEPATLSSFSGAIWKSGGLCIEEYPVKKIHHTDPKKKPSKGRTDLFFSLPDKTEFVVEAKQVWPIGSKSIPSAIKKIKNKMEEAINDVHRHKFSLNKHRKLAVIFSSPIFDNPDKHCYKFDNCLDNYLSEVNCLDYDIIAHYFPDSCRNFAPGTDHWERIYPGVSLLVKDASPESVQI